ncbi:aspartate-semialdehyde dehydrogenase [Nitrospina gracilis]|uniref:aspartate-semialdehyde dehydrogenase n=1 Tax=Nitrospina gracilis TaxID=35801 RepID=UPI001F02ABA7|nr:aspartate-semialdehyde dehydrogenase [Nitrospina gracilis]MCF8720518.1 aspartate-semialdehyde dehydrogenase [Nitrospina gracilis Nb-211]
MQKKDAYNVAVVGATGAVGRTMIATLEERKFPVAELRLLASSRSAGSQLPFHGKLITVQELKDDSFAGIDIALFSAGGSTSKQFGPKAVEAGCVVIDNSSAFRMEPGIPLVVPEVNPDALGDKPGIIANPNCSTIQMVMALKPLHDRFRVRRVIVSTYQSVSGSGQKAIDELTHQSRSALNCEPLVKNVYPHQIAFNCLPHIDSFLDNGYTKEEMKMVNETRKIMGDDTISVTPTTVRVPVVYSHSESVYVETDEDIDVAEVRRVLSAFPGVSVVDAPEKNEYPLAIDAAGRDEVMVGRIRKDLTNPKALNLWVVADNLRKGAALNAVQIAEVLIR